MKIGISCVCCILVTALAIPAGIPEQIPAVGQNHEWAALAAIQPESNIAVSTTDGETFKGKFKRVSEAELSLDRDGKTVDLERNRISTVWLLNRSLKKPVLIGLAIGAGAGAVLGIAAGNCNKSDFICFDRKVTVPVGAAVLGIFGTVGGLVVGLLHHHKTTIYQSQ